MQSSVPIPILSIIEQTVQEVVAKHYETVGVLSSASTARLLIYQQSLENSGIKVLSPDPKQQTIIDEVIVHVMGGTQGQIDVLALQTVMKQLQEQGAEAIVLGCTELPLAIDQSQSHLPLFDTIQIMVNAALYQAYEAK